MEKIVKEKSHAKGSVSEVATVAAVIIGHAEDNQAELILRRPLWISTYYSELADRFTGYLGSLSGEDRLKAQRDQTKIVRNLNINGKEKLSSFKIQLNGDFRKDKVRLSEILLNLGFTTYFANAMTGGEKHLVDLLERFNTNMINPLQAEIVTKGGDLANILAIKVIATALPAANILQEKLKGDKTEVTEIKIADYNDAYDELMSICKICANIYKDFPAKRRMFSYAHTLTVLRGGTPAIVVPDPPIDPVDPPVDPVDPPVDPPTV